MYEDLDRFVGKYVDITDRVSNEGGSGWVVKVGPPYYSELLNATGRSVVFDYGMGFFVSEGVDIKEIEPPEDDPGLFNPDNSPLPFP